MVNVSSCSHCSEGHLSLMSRVSAYGSVSQLSFLSHSQSVDRSLCQHRPMSGTIAPQYDWLFRRQVLPLCPSLGPLHIQVHFRICWSSSRIEKKGPYWDSDWNFIEFVDQLGG